MQPKRTHASSLPSSMAMGMSSAAPVLSCSKISLRRPDFMATPTGSSNLSPSLETKCTTLVEVAMLCWLGE